MCSLVLFSPLAILYLMQAEGKIARERKKQCESATEGEGAGKGRGKDRRGQGDGSSPKSLNNPKSQLQRTDGAADARRGLIRSISGRTFKFWCLKLGLKLELKSSMSDALMHVIAAMLRWQSEQAGNCFNGSLTPPFPQKFYLFE